MFTGLVAAIGSVTTLDRDSAGARIEFDSALATELEVGDSVAVNGVCLSATAVRGSSFSADIVAETLARTTLGELAVGSSVNLELPLRASDRLGGHVVLGHVDGVGEVRALRDDGGLEVAIGPELARYVVEKGSIALDGVSLTVAAIEDRLLTVALIPQTLRTTTLGALAPGGRVNVEVDVLAKHVEKLVAA
jgi:riboflavin synthase